jgi:hypothetical protein
MSASLWSASGLRPELVLALGFWGLGLTERRLRVGHSNGQGFGRRVGSWLLMGRPGALDRLAGDFQVLDDLRPRPDRGALARLGGMLDQLVQPWVAPAVTGRLYCQGSPPGCRVAQPLASDGRNLPLHKGSRLHRNPARRNLTHSATLASAFLPITLRTRIRFPLGTSSAPLLL